MPAQTKEKNLEEDIESFLCSPEGGFFKCDDRHSLLYVEDGTYQMVGGGYMEHRDRALDAATLVNFIQTTQPKAWDRFERMCNSDSTAKFAKVFNDAVDRLGMVAVLKHGFKHRGIPFKVVFFKPESGLNESAADRYAKNVCRCIRQFHFAETGNQTIDMVLDVNGIPLVSIELKDQFTGQDVENAMRQWREDRDPRCRCLKFNTRMVAFFAVDLENVYMTTKLEGAKTFFLPFNQGSAGAGNDGGAGNPANPDGYATSHLWEVALQKDSLLDIVNKFLHLEVKEETELDARGNEVKRKKERIISPVTTSSTPCVRSSPTCARTGRARTTSCSIRRGRASRTASPGRPIALHPSLWMTPRCSTPWSSSPTAECSTASCRRPSRASITPSARS